MKVIADSIWALGFEDRPNYELIDKCLHDIVGGGSQDFDWNSKPSEEAISRHITKFGSISPDREASKKPTPLPEANSPARSLFAGLRPESPSPPREMSPENKIRPPPVGGTSD